MIGILFNIDAKIVTVSNGLLQSEGTIIAILAANPKNKGVLCH
jgi:hypothetical protein